MIHGTAHLIWVLETDSELHVLCRPAICRDTQEILDAAIRSAAEGVTVTLPN